MPSLFPSRLHIPQVPARPGDQPDFAYVRLSPAGALPCPPITVEANQTHELATGLVRVLDDEHQAVGEWNPKLEPAVLIEGLRWMLTTRQLDDRMQRLQRQGRIAFYIRSLGEEAVSVAAGLAMLPHDMLFPSYRNTGLFLVRGSSILDLMCQILSNTRDMCKGRQLPLMYQSREGRVFSISGNLATQFPQAVGWAMAAAIRGTTDVAAVWIGEGSTAEGDFHYGMLFASSYRAPVVLNVVNNQWAISTFQGVSAAGQKSFAVRGPALGVPGIRVDGNDFLAVHAATQWAAARARAGHGATLIEHVTYRAGAHSTSDDPARYRPAEDYKHWPLGDPIERLKQHLVRVGAWSEAQQSELLGRIDAEIARNWQEAQAHGTMGEGPQLDRALMFEDVFAKVPDHLRKQLAMLIAERDERP